MNFGTLIGLSAILLWGLSALLFLQLKNIPPFQIIATTYFISCLILLGKLTFKKQWHKIKQPMIIWLLGIIGIYCTTVFYVLALKLAPPAIVVLIAYTWPILTMFFTLMNPKDKFQLSFITSCLLAYIGIFLLVTEKQSNFYGQSKLGYLLAFMSALSWAAYSYFAPYFRQYHIEAIGIYILIGMIISLLTHYTIEVTVVPSTYQLCILIFMGLTVSGPAFLLWEYGIKYGDHRFLFIASYASPVISNGLLILAGEAKATFYLLLATLLVSLGAYITTSYRSYSN